MNERIGVSGCFGGSDTVYPIDDIEEVEAAVGEIVETETPAGEEPAAQAPNLALAQLVVEYTRRVRLLTWAVIAMAAVLVIKEIKK